MSQHLFYVFCFFSFLCWILGNSFSFNFQVINSLFSCTSFVLSPILCKIFFFLEILFDLFSIIPGHFGCPSTVLIDFIFYLFKLLHVDLLCILYLIISLSPKDGLNKLLLLLLLLIFSHCGPFIYIYFFCSYVIDLNFKHREFNMWQSQGTTAEHTFLRQILGLFLSSIKGHCKPRNTSIVFLGLGFPKMCWCVWG